jgi:hypothetical protein
MLDVACPIGNGELQGGNPSAANRNENYQDSLVEKISIRYHYQRNPRHSVERYKTLLELDPITLE